ncbi:MAG: AAA family ATPase [Oscillospiraceae bacterium]|nr:AAA family ATPase [Oscillospiraceae bacterium]
MVDSKLAEFSTIGSLLIDGDCLSEIEGLVIPDDFTISDCRKIYEEALAMSRAGEDLDPVILLTRSGVDPDTGTQYLETTATSANAALYAQEVHRSGVKRRLLGTVQQAAGALLGPADPLQVAAQVAQVLEDTLDNGGGEDTSTTGLLNRWFNQWTEPPASVFTFPSLDALLSGFAPGTLNIIGGRPGQGKSALAVAMAGITALAHRTTYISLEMSSEDVVSRILSALSGVSYSKFRAGADNLDQERRGRIPAATQKFTTLKLSIHDKPGLTGADLYAICRREKTEVLFIDNLGNLDGPGENEYTRITKISGDLKRMAMSLKIPVVALCQLSREAAKSRENDRPGLAHLRSSGAIEQDADSVMLIYRDLEGLDKHAFEVNIAKNRRGPTGRVTLECYLETNRFQDGSFKSWEVQT